MYKGLLLTLLLSFLVLESISQDVGSATRLSQSRTEIANTGNCTITIQYHSPLVNGRKIFGGIVPFDFVVDGQEYPWRAGANERTTIEFSHDVVIEGKKLAAGEYGFVVLVRENEWELIFSLGKSWGAFAYEKENDAIRVIVQPEKRPFQEWLSYDFKNPTTESVEVELRWEQTAVSFQMKTDAIANKLFDLYKIENKSASNYQELAVRTLDQNPNEKGKALKYLEQSRAKIEENEDSRTRQTLAFNYKILKGELLQQMGQVREGEQMIEEALASAEGFNIYYYALNKLLIKGQSDEAFRLLQSEVERDPKNRANHFALGEYYLKVGDQKKATESFKEAYELAIGTRGERYAKYVYHQNRKVLERQN